MRQSAHRRWLADRLWAKRRGVRSSMLVLMVLVVGCKGEMSERDLIAAKADQTTRQLIAGLNSKNTPVLSTLIVVTNAAGGQPRALTEEEKKQLIYAHPPYEYVGSGKPGTMVLRDGRGQKRAVRLIVLNDQLKVLATKESFSAYTARESGGTGTGANVDATVVSFLWPEG